MSKLMTVRIPDHVYRAMEDYAKRRMQSRGSVIVEALERILPGIVAPAGQDERVPYVIKAKQVPQPVRYPTISQVKEVVYEKDEYSQ
jgi:hypothetical protein